MRQRLSNHKLNWWQGILLIVGIVLILTAAQFLATMFTYFIGGDTTYAVASVGFWVFGGAVALMVVRAFIMDYEYAAEGLTFQINRIYGASKPRLAVSIVTRSITGFGTPEEIEGIYPGIHPRLYTRPRLEIPVMALAYEEGGSVKVVHIQPNPEFSTKLADWAAQGGKK